MRSALARKQVANTVSTPAPLGGWNARDPLSQMPETDAIQLDNMLNVDGALQLRGGTASWATLTGGGEVGTLAVWNGPTSSELWAITAGNAFNVSTTGTKTANATFAGFFYATSYWSWVMFNNVAGHYLYMCAEDGASSGPVHYNGTTWAQPAITGVSEDKLVHVNLFKYRLFFVEEDSLNLWYLPVDALQGAATKLPLGGYFNKGGYILATGTWTVDGGDGVNDLLCVLTNVGQCAVFQGDNPSSATSWSLVGVFDIAEPLGRRRCLSKFGADLYVLTMDGVFSMAKIMAGQVLGEDALTEKVRTAFTTYARQFKDERGWQAVYYPRGRYFMINMPSLDGVSPRPVQVVLSTTSKTWARFINQWGLVWVVYNDRLYYGRVSSAVVYRADDGFNDIDGTTVAGGANTIEVWCRQAFQHLGDRSVNKYVTLVRPVFESDALGTALAVTWGGVRAHVDHDYNLTVLPINSVYLIDGPGAVSDDGRYDRPGSTRGDWVMGALGRCVSLVWKTNVRDCAQFGWLSTEYVFEHLPTGII